MPAKSTRRVSVDLTPPAAAEIDRMRATTGLTTADLFRHAVTLLRIYVIARAEGKEFRVVDPKNPAEQVRLEMCIPVHVGSRKATDVKESPVTTSD
jgi:hypothetical protein